MLSKPIEQTATFQDPLALEIQRRIAGPRSSASNFTYCYSRPRRASRSDVLGHLRRHRPLQQLLG
jgi:hypothetical protein